jgi:hypothetical protein
LCRNSAEKRGTLTIKGRNGKYDRRPSIQKPSRLDESYHKAAFSTRQKMKNRFPMRRVADDRDASAGK